jgi:streptogramin lyase
MKKSSLVLTLVMLFIFLISCDDKTPARTAAFNATIETYAGSAFGYSGDGGTAKSATLGYITGLSIDPSDNIFVSDAAANTIRKISGECVIHTVAGTFIGFNQVDPLQYSGDGGAATDAHLNVPLSVAVDWRGNVYIADTGNNALRKVDLTGKISTLVVSELNQPNAVTTDAAGNIYFCDTQNGAIRKIAANSGNVSLVADKLHSPNAIAIDNNGNIYFTDDNSLIKRLSTSGALSTIAGPDAQLVAPRGIAINPDGNLLISDSGNNSIRMIDIKSGQIETIAGTGEAGYFGDGGPAVNAKLSNPQGIVVDSKGNIYVAESGNSVIRVIKPIN